MKKTKVVMAAVAIILIGGTTIWYMWHALLIQKEQQDLAIEQSNIAEDNYNFEQLEKVKGILTKTSSGSYNFYGPSDFNKQFHTAIMPKRNCYYMWSKNGNHSYIFGFKLESKKYRSQYGSDFFAYPKYELPPEFICTSDCTDLTLDYFRNVISHPCDRDTR